MRLALRPALAVFAGLALVMAATRVHHFGMLPDASWAVFFAAGAWLAGHQRWAFPALMALAVLIDWYVITAAGLSFWAHYCVSPGYWFLLPAHAAMLAAGRWTTARGGAPRWALLARFVPALALGIVACHLLAQGGFYWFSSSVAEPTLAGWWKNFSDWLPAYAQVAAGYATLFALIHVGAQTLVAGRPALRTA
ncbi:MAG TPA: hypothetical protein DCM32_06685 [Xanthomonadaceae bacterium]|nr:hypothetical protein [Xanthomonadaceae bacterium]